MIPRLVPEISLLGAFCDEEVEQELGILGVRWYQWSRIHIYIIISILKILLHCLFVVWICLPVSFVVWAVCIVCAASLWVALMIWHGGIRLTVNLGPKVAHRKRRELLSALTILSIAGKTKTCNILHQVKTCITWHCVSAHTSAKGYDT